MPTPLPNTGGWPPSSLPREVTVASGSVQILPSDVGSALVVTNNTGAALLFLGPFVGTVEIIDAGRNSNLHPFEYNGNIAPQTAPSIFLQGGSAAWLTSDGTNVWKGP